MLCVGFLIHLAWPFPKFLVQQVLSAGLLYPKLPLELEEYFTPGGGLMWLSTFIVLYISSHDIIITNST